MNHEIERIAEYHSGDKVWRTTCKCMGDDDLTFTVATDDECPEVYLEMYVKCSSYYRVWDTPAWSRPFRSFWRRLTAAITLLFKGYVEVEGAFLFRGEKQIDAVTETIQEHKKYLIERRKTADWKEQDAGHWLRNEENKDGE
jgi:hypothetical protein